MTLSRCAGCGAPAPALPMGWKLLTTPALEGLAVFCPPCVRAPAAIAQAVRTALARFAE